MSPEALQHPENHPSNWKRSKALRIGMVVGFGFATATGVTTTARTVFDLVNADLNRRAAASQEQPGGVMPSAQIYQELVTPIPEPLSTPTLEVLSAPPLVETNSPTPELTQTQTPTKTPEPTETSEPTSSPTSTLTPEPTKTPTIVVLTKKEEPSPTPTSTKVLELSPTTKSTPTIPPSPTASSTPPPTPTSTPTRVDAPPTPTKTPPKEATDPKQQLINATKADLAGRLGASPDNIKVALYATALIWRKDGTIICPGSLKDGTGTTRSGGWIIGFYLKGAPTVGYTYFGDPSVGDFAFCGIAIINPRTP